MIPDFLAGLFLGAVGGVFVSRAYSRWYLTTSGWARVTRGAPPTPLRVIPWGKPYVPMPKPWPDHEQPIRPDGTREFGLPRAET